jgi:hypothetical protein
VTTQRVGIIDDHAHPFPLTPQPFELAEISLDVETGPNGTRRRQDLAPGRLTLEILQVQLSKYLGCPVRDLEAAREQAARDWPGYVRGLFDDVGLTGMLLDGGSQPLDEPALKNYSALTNRPIWSMFRVEAVLDPMIAAGLGAQEILDGVSNAITAAAATGAVACKTVLAYRTGLAVDAAATLLDAQTSLNPHDPLPVRRRGKALRDLVLRQTLAQCGDLGLPLQVHTGYGDSELRLADADPLGLDDILRTPEGQHARVVLIHAAYPWHEKVAYLAAVRASVWAEFSLVNLLNPATSARRLLELIELAPTTRILVGSDGHGPPETHWFALTVLRQAWAQVRTQLDGLTRPGWLDQTEHNIFTDNARTLYRLTTD